MQTAVFVIIVTTNEFEWSTYFPKTIFSPHNNFITEWFNEDFMDPVQEDDYLLYESSNMHLYGNVILIPYFECLGLYFSFFTKN